MKSPMSGDSSLHIPRRPLWSNAACSTRRLRKFPQPAALYGGLRDPAIEGIAIPPRGRAAGPAYPRIDGVAPGDPPRRSPAPPSPSRPPPRRRWGGAIPNVTSPMTQGATRTPRAIWCGLASRTNIVPPGRCQAMQRHGHVKGSAGAGREIDRYRCCNSARLAIEDVHWMQCGTSRDFERPELAEEDKTISED